MVLNLTEPYMSQIPYTLFLKRDVIYKRAHRGCFEHFLTRKSISEVNERENKWIKDKSDSGKVAKNTFFIALPISLFFFASAAAATSLISYFDVSLDAKIFF